MELSHSENQLLDYRSSISASVGYAITPQKQTNKNKTKWQKKVIFSVDARKKKVQVTLT